MKKSYYSLIALTFATMFIGLMISCGSGDGVTVEDGEIKGQATLPLLPIDIPIFPTDVTLDGLVDSVQSELDDQDIPDWLQPSEGAIQDFFDDVEKKLRNASIEILQPGVLSVAVDEQIADSVRDYVKVTQVGVNFKVSNDTDVWVSVPVEFQLFLGDGEKAEAWDASAMIPFADPRVDEDGQFIVKPGETIDLSIKNVPNLVDAINNSYSIGIGYKALYRMADFDNGANWKEILDKFGLCLIEGLLTGSTSQCPSVEELLQWHLTVKKFELVIKAESDFNIPEIPGCTEFADEFNLDYLKDACPQ